MQRADALLVSAAHVPMINLIDGDIHTIRGSVLVVVDGHEVLIDAHVPLRISLVLISTNDWPAKLLAQRVIIDREIRAQAGASSSTTGCLMTCHHPITSRACSFKYPS